MYIMDSILDSTSSEIELLLDNVHAENKGASYIHLNYSMICMLQKKSLGSFIS